MAFNITLRGTDSMCIVMVKGIICNTSGYHSGAIYYNVRSDKGRYYPCMSSDQLTHIN